MEPPYDYLTVRMMVSASSRESFIRDNGIPVAESSVRRELPDWISIPLRVQRTP
jgi:hypothetical protein